MDDHCEIKPIQKIISAEEMTRSQHAYLAISGLNCPNCATRVRNALISCLGVTDVVIDHFDGLGDVTYNPDQIQPASIVEVISKAGDGGKHSYSAMVLV